MHMADKMLTAYSYYKNPEHDSFHVLTDVGS
jgi:hypothetical protein